MLFYFGFGARAKERVRNTKATWKNRTRADRPQAAKRILLWEKNYIAKKSHRRPAAAGPRGPEKIARFRAAESAARSANIMHEHLPALAAKIRTALSTRPEYFVTQPVELRILRGMSEAEIKDFAASHGWRVVPRLGGRQVEFYNDASRRVEL